MYSTYVFNIELFKKFQIMFRGNPRRSGMNIVWDVEEISLFKWS
jgi:hypothetical protein